ncbi:hypothetical protein ACIQF6_07850 [Kitasatospora sp. NPDC092948]|uniref:hypothetical protein n=1 Tax=Kitasatospora sp. NPDC092948 TaxID=3364088 RepID=UPI00382842FF
MSTNEHEDLSYAMEVLADRQPPPGRPPTAELVRRGRLRKRRRAAVMTGGVAAVAAVAMAGAFVVGGSGSPAVSGIGPAAGASGSTTPTELPSSRPTNTGLPSTRPTNTSSPSSKPTDTGSPSSKPSGAPTADLPLANLLEARLPAGYHIVSTWNQPATKPGDPWRAGAGHTITNGSRTGNMRIELTQVTGVRSGSTDYKPTADCGSVPNCTVTQRPDGSVLMVVLPPAAPGGLQDWKALLYGTDGTLVTASSGTVPGPGEGSDIYPGPPVLNGDQLTALALDPVWQGIIHQH